MSIEFNIILASLSVAIITGFIGSFIMWRRMSYFGDSLSHSSLLGVALGILFSINIDFVVLIVCCLFAFLFVWLSSSKILYADSLMGVLAYFMLSLGLIAFGFVDGEHSELHGSIGGDHADLHDYLMGNIFLISTTEAMLAFVCVVIVVGVLIYNWQSLLLFALDRDLAKAEGVNIFWCNLLLTISMAAAVVLGIKIGGILLTGAMLIIPASISRQFSLFPKNMIIYAIAIGFVAIISGAYLSANFSQGAGPIIVVLLSFGFFVSFLANNTFNKKNTI